MDPTLRWTLLTITAMTGALGAVVALPFTLIRIRQTQRQTDLQDEALFNDKINAAATDLAALHEQTQVAMTVDGEIARDTTGAMVILKTWEDDLVTRAAAIDRLEGLALERADVAPRIARMLSIYVQELSRENPAETPPEGATPRELREWAEALRPIRPDMERAVQSLGRINPRDDDARAAFDPKNIDLRHCNLQGFDLGNLNFQGAQFGKAQMQGANFFGAQMQAADLFGAQMQGAYLIGAEMQGAILNWAEMQGADLGGAQLQGANLFWAQLQGADLSGAEMQGADLSAAQMQEALLRKAKLQEAILSTAKMQGADLWESELQGAVLWGAEMSDFTNLTGASLRGVGVSWVNEITLEQLQAHGDWPDIFHPDDKIDFDDFTSQWRAFAAALDPPVTIAFDYND